MKRIVKKWESSEVKLPVFKMMTWRVKSQTFSDTFAKIIHCNIARVFAKRFLVALRYILPFLRVGFYSNNFCVRVGKSSTIASQATSGLTTSDYC